MAVELKYKDSDRQIKVGDKVSCLNGRMYYDVNTGRYTKEKNKGQIVKITQYNVYVNFKENCNGFCADSRQARKTLKNLYAGIKTGQFNINWGYLSYINYEGPVISFESEE